MLKLSIIFFFLLNGCSALRLGICQDRRFEDAASPPLTSYGLMLKWDVVGQKVTALQPWDYWPNDPPRKDRP